MAKPWSIKGDSLGVHLTSCRGSDWATGFVRERYCSVCVLLHTLSWLLSDGIRRAAADPEEVISSHQLICTYPLGCKAPHPRSGEVFPSMWRFPSPPQPPPLEPCRDHQPNGQQPALSRSPNSWFPPCDHLYIPTVFIPFYYLSPTSQQSSKGGYDRKQCKPTASRLSAHYYTLQ